MNKFIFMCVILFLGVAIAPSYAEEGKSKIILLIAEQNIEGPQTVWWLSEINLSATEATVARTLIERGFQVLEPSEATKIIKQDKGFRRLDLSEGKSIKLGKLAKANYVILGKAIASSGSKVPRSSMVSCFANITAKLIRVKDGKVIAYLEATGNSAHMDAITGGKEALTNAGSDLAVKVIEALKNEGGR